MRKFFKMLIGIGLIPFCWAISKALYSLHQQSLMTELSGRWDAWALPAGFLLWVLIFFLLPRPFRTYVLGHELTHALWGLLMGSRVGKMKIGSSGGYVELSKTNCIIALAPYFFPFYTFMVIAIYYLIGLSRAVEPYQVWWFAAVGLTWSFHVTFTLQMLAQQQSDVQQHGRIFSYTLIYIMNLFLAGIWMVVIGPPRTATFFELLMYESGKTYSFTYAYLSSGWTHASALILQKL